MGPVDAQQTSFEQHSYLPAVQSNLQVTDWPDIRQQNADHMRLC
jgi:hypothetical protein